MGWWRLLAACVFLTPCCFSRGETAARGAEADYLGAVRCLDCHTRPAPLRQKDGSTDRVALTEAHTWLDVDKHSMAFDALKSDASLAMAKRLGIVDVSQEASCLSCHAGWIKGRSQPPRLELGVSCEACHGPSSLYDLPHTRADWRAKSADEKASLGMVDVRDPARGAEQCLSCHVGDAAEGKLLTHAMYAAGHPPLSGFELASFARAMPPHWRTPREKRSRTLANEPPRRHEGDLPEVRAVVIGGAAALRSSVRLFVERAASDELAGGWPDFARYDCAACHHELEVPSWRQARASAGRPGQLHAPTWPTVLAELGVRGLARRDARRAERLADAMALAFKSNGAEPSATLPAVDELLRELGSLTFDKAAAMLLLHDLCELGQRPDLDFDSARQLGWAFRAVYAAANDAPIDHRPKQELDQLSGMLSLDLPSTRSKALLSPARRQAMFHAVGDYRPDGKQGVNRLFASLKGAL